MVKVIHKPGDTMSDYKPFYRSTTNRVFAGIAGGMGDYFDIDPLIFRILFVILAIPLGGLVLLLYVLGWLFIPEGPIDAAEKSKAKANADKEEDLSEKVDRVAEEFRQKVETGAEAFEKKHGSHHGNARIGGGLILIVIGILFLLDNLIAFDVWGKLWPLILVAIGLGIISRRTHSDK
jgi:phage shock protein PspC (stress-responsive transcriptional regulator)